MGQTEPLMLINSGKVNDMMEVCFRCGRSFSDEKDGCECNGK